MAKLSILAGSTSQTVNIFIADSSSTTGAGLTGLAYNTGSLVAYYALPRAAAVAITLATQTVTGAYSSGGFVEISSANMPGWYRLDLPDAAIASGRFVSVHLKGAANMAPLPLEIELTGWNNQDAVRGGLTALPNANAEASGGLYTRGTGAGQITQSTNGQIDVDAKKINSVSTSSVTTINANVGQTQPVNFTGTGASALIKSDMVDVAGAAVSTSTAQIGVNAVNIGGTAQTGRDLGASVLLSSGTGTGQLDFTSGVVKGNLVQMGGVAQSATDLKDFADDGYDPATNKVQGVVLTDTVTTYTGNTPQTGDNYARLGAPAGASVSADIAAVQADTDNIQTRIPTSLVSGRMDASVGAYQSGLTPLQPTTAGRTLDVTATGEAGIDWANIGAPTTTVNLSGTTVKTATDVETDTQDIQSRLPAALVSGRIDSSVGAMAANTLTASALAADAVAEVADGVWDEAIAGHLSAGSTGAALNAAGSAGDPWTTSLPGAYIAGQAGYIVGHNIDATITSRTKPADTQPASLSSSERNAVADATLDRADAIEVGLTLRQAQRVQAAAAAGELSGAATTTVTIRNAQADSKDRIVATVDADGNRTAVTLDVT